MAKRRAAWDRCYDQIRVYRNPGHLPQPPATDADLDEVEAQLRSRLPHSYRQFMKRFGSGELQGWVRLYPITRQRKGYPWTVVGRTTELRDHFRKHADFFSNHEWLSSLVTFASNGGGDEYAWDPAAVTRRRPHECQFYFLPRLEEERPVRAGASFWEFVEWVVADIRSWDDGDGEGAEVDQSEIYFNQAFLRAKKRPLKRDVQLWLMWNNGTVFTLARSIRDQGRTDTFPILADALEDAGCTNRDLLDSCRHGIPEIDGTWVLQVLLGKE